MVIKSFPDPSEAGPEGLVAVGGDLEPASLLKAYRAGIFPWPIEGLPLTWFSPPERGVLFFNNLHVAERLARTRSQEPFRLTLNQAFEDVIYWCANAPGREEQTWITEPMIKAYTRLHRLGHAHSVEAWDDDRLVGGIYGVEIDGTFSAESMFYLESDASKLALLDLIDRLRDAGAEWLDIQVITAHMRKMGAEAMPRKEFLKLLDDTRDSQKSLLAG